MSKSKSKSKGKAVEVFTEGGEVFAKSTGSMARRSVPVVLTTDDGDDSAREVFPSATALEEFLGKSSGSVSKAIESGWRIDGWRVRRATFAEAMTLTGAVRRSGVVDEGVADRQGFGLTYSREGRRVRVLDGVNSPKYPMILTPESGNGGPSIVLSSTEAAKRFGGSPGGWSAAALDGREFRGYSVRFASAKEFADAFPAAVHRPGEDKARIKARRAKAKAKPAPAPAPTPASLPVAAKGGGAFGGSVSAAVFVLSNESIADASAREVALAILSPLVE